jgi:nucleotide-binding universal stress UspA family protein
MRRILVGLDGSPRQSGVLQAAREMAERLGGQLILFRAVTLAVDYPPSIFGVPPDQVGELLVQAAKQQLDAVAAELPPGLVAGAHVELGSPWRAICDVARAEKADLIVVGSHGYSGLDRLLGTTAAKVVNHADRAVLVVR